MRRSPEKISVPGESPALLGLLFPMEKDFMIEDEPENAPYASALRQQYYQIFPSTALTCPNAHVGDHRDSPKKSLQNLKKNYFEALKGI
jgi:hypothetical protein